MVTPPEVLAGAPVLAGLRLALVHLQLALGAHIAWRALRGQHPWVPQPLRVTTPALVAWDGERRAPKGASEGVSKPQGCGWGGRAPMGDLGWGHPRDLHARVRAPRPGTPKPQMQWLPPRRSTHHPRDPPCQGGATMGSRREIGTHGCPQPRGVGAHTYGCCCLPAPTSRGAEVSGPKTVGTLWVPWCMLVRGAGCPRGC